VHAERLYPTLVPLLTDEFLNLSSYIISALQASIGDSGVSSDNTEAPLQGIDVMLPKVSEALVLVTQCLTTIFLDLEQGKISVNVAEETRKHVRQARYELGRGLVESLISQYQQMTILKHS
jgi:hypothetical protein